MISFKADFHAVTLTRERSTRSLLLDAGERKFGEFGIEACSLVAIAAEAGQANKYAVQYHFGNRENFINTILSVRMEYIEERRRELIDILASLDRPPCLIDFVWAMILPLAEQVDNFGRHSFARFFLQYFTQFTLWDGVDHPLLHASDESPTMKALRSCRELLPEIPDSTLQNRFMMQTRCTLGLLIERDNRIAKGHAAWPIENVVSEAAAMTGAALAAPLLGKPLVV